MTEETIDPRDRVRPGERLVTQFTPDQRGVAVAILAAFVGIAFGGPALTRLGERRRDVQSRVAEGARDARNRVHRVSKAARRKVRRLGGGTIWR